MANFGEWKTYLEGYIPCFFPKLSNSENADLTTSASVSAILAEPYCSITSFSNDRAVDVATVVCVAWGVVLQAYTGQDSACFAVSKPNIGPCRINFASDTVASDAIFAVQKDFDEKADLLDIPVTHLSPDDRFFATEFFNTCILCPTQRSQESFETNVTDAIFDNLTQFDIVVSCEAQESTARITLTYRAALLQKGQAIAVVNALERAVSEVITGQEKLEQFCLLNAEDRFQMNLRNMRLSESSDARIESLIRERCRRTPSALAVCAWDGNFSYEELNGLSAGLMHHLEGRGIGPEVFVPILFEKSRWVIIAMLGVMKAGGAFALLDPTHPQERLRNICDKTSARLIVSSSRQAELAARLVTHVVNVGDEAITAEMNRHIGENQLMDCNPAPRNALYAVFTSGSTGTPKVVINNHSSFLAAIPTYLEALELNENSRVFQFASHAFDVTIFDTLMTLVAGGCVCVPSNTDRSSDLANAIQHFGATHLSLTPTVARILDPRDVSTLQTIVLGGERPASSEVCRWVDHVRVVQLYGSSECAIMSMQCTSGPSSNIRTTNYDTGCGCWVVNPRNHEQLQPVGAVGELIVEGPVVGREYLDDPRQTSETFIQAPKWLCELRRGNRIVYRSGDLVRFVADGSIQYVGRKNTQVKLRGQRIELGEVEHHLKLAIPFATDCIAELVTAPDASRPPMLMAFVLSGTDAGKDSITAGRNAISDTVLAEPTPSFRSQIPSILSKISNALPLYMVPSVILPLTILPLTGTDKINRKLLRQLAAGLSREELEKYQPEKRTYRTPINDTEKCLHKFFAEALNLTMDEVGADDNFFSLGGESLTAMKMVAIARKANFSLTVQNIFDHPRLSELALHAKVVMEGNEEYPPPFALVAGEKQSIIRDAAQQCHLPRRVIEDVYPCTQLQKGLVAETMRDPDAFIANIELPLPRGIDIDRLRQAWTAVVKANPILRTRMILSTSYGLLQVVVREDIPWIVSDYPKCQKLVVVGRPLVQLILRHPREGADGPTRLFLNIHHAVYDGYALSLMFTQLNSAYYGGILAPGPVSPFIRYLTMLPDATDYWHSFCAGLETPSFPVLPHRLYRPSPDSKGTRTVSMLNPHATEYTPYTHVRLAWAITQAHQQSLQDIFYGTVVSGRNAPVNKIDLMMIPTVATIPCRLTLDIHSTVRKTLDGIQDVATQGIPFEQFGLAGIARLGKHAAHACSFQTLLVMQPALEQNKNDLFNLSNSYANYRADATYAINLFCELEREHLRVTALYDERIVPRPKMQKVLDNFTQTLHAIHAAPASLIGDILKDLDQNKKIGEADSA
uniref:Lysergyl peptide synthetase subunit 2 n=1 Tax=Epichloe inebrians TaxID=2591900 RepID=J9SYJ9_9HYPO|nr:lysergyl peptide synthetase subunit 2 [Epichloe inebrians]